MCFQKGKDLLIVFSWRLFSNLYTLTAFRWVLGFQSRRVRFRSQNKPAAEKGMNSEMRTMERITRVVSKTTTEDREFGCETKTVARVSSLLK